MNKKYRFPDRKGRLTIPHHLRQKLGITQNTLFCVQENANGTLTLRQQRFTDAIPSADCQVIEKQTSLLDFINRLSPTEQMAVYRHLSRVLPKEVDE